MAGRIFSRSGLRALRFATSSKGLASGFTGNLKAKHPGSLNLSNDFKGKILPNCLSPSKSLDTSLCGVWLSHIQSYKTQSNIKPEKLVENENEKDSAAEATELRDAFEEMATSMMNFRTALVILGCSQFLGGCWIGYYGSPSGKLGIWLWVCGLTLSFVLAFLVDQSLRPVHFFTKLEHGSQPKILTLSLHVAKLMSACFGRAHLVIRLIALGIAFILLADIGGHFMRLNHKELLLGIEKEVPPVPSSTCEEKLESD